LIAPSRVNFYDRDWNLRGTKSELGQVISEITGIEYEVLCESTALSSVPVARRMSWAANRQTTRFEDIAYSLLGIFDVNMPMLYGESENAFIRLQEEIIRNSNDLTLFAWQAKETNLTDGSNSASSAAAVQKYRGILAKTPAEFAATGMIDFYTWTMRRAWTKLVQSRNAEYKKKATHVITGQQKSHGYYVIRIRTNFSPEVPHSLSLRRTFLFSFQLNFEGILVRKSRTLSLFEEPSYLAFS
jgi:hypothetical protein